ncbi:hypothetical protein [Microbulbifer sp. VAAF005]|uniref:hypothetical protein n=1 Tax=Microbulbifer sp. VAAF005 TaxID=3034230 RepID=UPI0024ADF62A|nr:hypothetical protein [Microbulbifer sp. VAAF005]WHI45396.1 hypothetical protein P0078_16905 [Microbulbifer sp. VAAF005]
MRLILLIITSMIILGCASAPIGKTEPQKNNEQLSEQLTLEEFCQKNECRKDIHIKFRTDGEPVDKKVDMYWPRVFNDVISVLPGESFYVEADVANGKLVNLKEVPEVVSPEKTITIKFSQMDEKTMMMLSLSNPFEDVILKFNMEMIDFNGNPHQTSSCPVIPGGSIYESWPHAIPELIIKNPVAKLKDEMESLVCIY